MENRKQYDYLIVGAGLFGSVFAYEASQAGKHCLVIDKRQNTGGNIFARMWMVFMCINMVLIFSTPIRRKFGNM